jgi:hypothetical protein
LDELSAEEQAQLDKAFSRITRRSPGSRSYTLNSARRREIWRDRFSSRRLSHASEHVRRWVTIGAKIVFWTLVAFIAIPMACGS